MRNFLTPQKRPPPFITLAYNFFLTPLMEVASANKIIILFIISSVLITLQK